MYEQGELSQKRTTRNWLRATRGPRAIRPMLGKEPWVQLQLIEQILGDDENKGRQSRVDKLNTGNLNSDQMGYDRDKELT